MTDARLRESERRYRAFGTADDGAAWLLERVRAGELPMQRLRLLAALGHEPARHALGGGGRVRQEWVEEVCGERTVAVRAAMLSCLEMQRVIDAPLPRPPLFPVSHAGPAVPELGDLLRTSASAVLRGRPEQLGRASKAATEIARRLERRRDGICGYGEVLGPNVEERRPALAVRGAIRALAYKGDAPALRSAKESISLALEVVGERASSEWTQCRLGDQDDVPDEPNEAIGAWRRRQQAISEQVASAAVERLVGAVSDVLRPWVASDGGPDPLTFVVQADRSSGSGLPTRT